VNGVLANQEQIIAWKLDATGMPIREAAVNTAVSGGYYTTGQLSIKSTKDEQGNEVREYVDKQGQSILKKVQAIVAPTLSNPAHWTNTYYIYDDLNQLRYVLQPELSKTLLASATVNPTQTQLDNLAFQYKYDARMTHKKVPGAGWVYMVYDLRDRPVMTQDANQRTANKWSFTKYDALNRPIITGIYTHTALIDQAAMGNLISTTNFYETYNGDIANHGYTNTVFAAPNFTIANLEVLTVTYYDNYDFKALFGNVAANDYKINQLAAQTSQTGTYAQEATFNNLVRGLATATKTKVLGTANYLLGITYYDQKYRPIQMIADNHKGGKDCSTTIYDFVGKALATKTTHAITVTPAQADKTVARTFNYDHAGRLLKTFHSVNGATPVLLAQNEYNEIGQLIDKKLHSTNNGTSFKQSIDYRYNIRGWLTFMNNSRLFNDGVTNDDTGFANKSETKFSRTSSCIF
jgi:hypothetical protein